jgi:antitoxin component of MazEF toxin-antitoxin module
MQRRLFKTGNSVVLSLPKDILEELGLADGRTVDLEFDREARRLIITPAEKPYAVAGIDEIFARQVNDFIEQYRSALDELAK